MANKRKVEVIIEDDKGKEIGTFFTKTLTKIFNKLPQGTPIKFSIDEGKEFAPQIVGDYVVKGLPNQPVANKPPIVEVTTPINVLQHTDVVMTAKISDPDGIIEDTNWTQLPTGAPTVTLTILEGGTYSASFHAHDYIGTYKFQLDVVDNESATTTKEVVVNVTEMPMPHDCPMGQHWDEVKQMCVEDTPTPTPGKQIWNSNTDGKWNDGNKRTITIKQGPQDPCDKSIFVAASGSPKLDIDGDGVAHLVAGSGEAQNLSLKLRSRHQAGGDCQNRFGGLGCSFDRSGIDMKTESCHNFHENSIGGSHDGIKNDEWHHWRFDAQDTNDGKIEFNVWLDGKHVKQGFHNSPKPYYLDKGMFAALSWVWIRINNSAHGRIYICACNYNASFEGDFKFESGKPSIALKDVTLNAL